MKRIVLTFIYMHSMSIGHASNINAENDLIDAAKNANMISSELGQLGQINVSCIQCEDKNANKSYVLSDNEMKIETPYYLKKVDPYFVHLKRTKNSPEKVKIKFKNSQKICGKTTAYSLPNGGLEVACLIYVAQYVEEEIEIDFRKLPPIKNDSVEVYQLKLTKENSDKYKYNLDFKLISNDDVEVFTSSKFWGNGYNIKLEEKSK